MNNMSIEEIVDFIPTKEAANNHMESLRWGGFIVSPFDVKSKVYRCFNKKYKCKNTGKYFNVKTGTIFENSKTPLHKWFWALHSFCKSNGKISSRRLSDQIGVGQKAAWHILKTLKYAVSHENYFWEISKHQIGF